MKKLLLSASAFALVAVSGMTLVPTEAEALPAFARQTGAACSSCHFQTFPALNSFGRSFMMNSFTDVGDQALIEDDSLSIPSVLNATFEVRGGYTNKNVTGVASTGTWKIPDRARLFLAGRVGTNSGAFIMFLPNAAAPAGPTPVWMFLNSWDVGDYKIGLSAHKSPWGASNIMEVSNVFGHRGDKLGGQDVSAITNSGFTKMTTGIGSWVGNNDIGYVQFSLVAPAVATTGATDVGTSLGKLVRVVALFDLAGWDTLVGFGNVSGSAGKGVAGGAAVGGVATNVRIPMDIQFVDVQLQGDAGDATVGLYADWAHAKGKSSNTGAGNFYGALNGSANTAGNKFDAYSVRTEVAPMENVILGVGYGFQKQTQAAGQITNKILHLAATYKVYQNLDLNLTYNNEKLTPLGGLTSTTTRTTVLEFDAMM